MVNVLLPVSERAPLHVVGTGLKISFPQSFIEKEAQNNEFPAQVAYAPESHKRCNTGRTSSMIKNRGGVYNAYLPIKVSNGESEFAYLSLITDSYSHEAMDWRLGRD